MTTIHEYYMVKTAECEDTIVLVEDEKEWESTVKYLQDAGVKFSSYRIPWRGAIPRLGILSPGELSDILLFRLHIASLLAPRER